MSANTEQRRQSLANWKIDDPGASGAIRVDRSGYVPIVTAAAESRTVDDPTKGGMDLTLEMKTDGGDCTITFDTAFTEAGDTTLVLNDAGQLARFYSIESGTSYVWRRYASDPVEAATITTLTATTVNATTVAPTTIAMPSGTFATTTGMTLEDNEAAAQATNISTAVAIVGAAGIITTQAADAAAAAENAFSVTNASLAGTELVLISAKYNGTTGTPIVAVGDQAAGSFTITITNVHASDALNGTFNIKFWIVNMN
jgi:hypothetical protein